MTIDEFVRAYDGTYQDFDKHFGDQCKDLFSLYNLEVVGNVNYVWGNAVNLWDNAPDEYYERVTLNPRKGDVVIWGTGIGPYGHVAIYLAGDENNFTSFDQNFPIGSPCHKQNHNYKNVIGYLRPRKEDMETKGFSDEHMKGVLKNGFREMRKQLLGNVDEAGLEADANFRLDQTKNGNLDPVKDQFKDYMRAGDMQWMKKSDCKQSGTIIESMPTTDILAYVIGRLTGTRK